MKLTLKDIKDAESALTRILMSPIEFKLAYRLNKITKKFITEIKRIEEKRVELVETKYGVKKEGTTGFSVPSEKMDDFVKEFTEYLEQESDINIQPIPYEIIDKSGIKISMNDMTTLEKFIEPSIEESQSTEKK